MRQEWVGKRQAVRTTVQLRAQMRFESGRPPVECTITDISLFGARLTVPDAGPYPDDFDIFIPARSETKWARVRWREDLQLGVEFPKGRRNDESGATTAILSRLAALEKRSEQDAEPLPAFDASPQIGALEARLAALEQRSSLLDRDEPPSDPEVGNAWLEAMLERTAELETRCQAIETGMQRNAEQLNGLGTNMADLARKIEGLMARPEPEPPQEPHQASSVADAQADPLLLAQAVASGSIETRMRALEGAATELRGSLQALILLLSAQIARSKPS